MKKRMKWMAMAGAAVLALSLTACGSGLSLNLGNEKERMEGYVQGYLDLTYLGKLNEDYQTEMELTEEEAQERYEEGIQVEVEFFESGVGLIDYPTEEITQRLTELYKEIYSHSDYTVGAATKLDSGNYAVEVTVRPIDIMTKVSSEDFQAIFDQILTQRGITTQEQLEALSEEEYQEIDGEYANQVVELLEAQLPGIGHGEAETFTVQIEDDGDIWTPSQDDFNSIDLAIIDYSNFGY